VGVWEVTTTCLKPPSVVHSHPCGRAANLRGRRLLSIDSQLYDSSLRTGRPKDPVGYSAIPASGWDEARE